MLQEGLGLGSLVWQVKEGSALTPCPKGLGMVPLGLERGLGLSQITHSYSWRQLLLNEEGFTSCVQISELLPCFWIWVVGEKGRDRRPHEVCLPQNLPR